MSEKNKEPWNVSSGEIIDKDGYYIIKRKDHSTCGHIEEAKAHRIVTCVNEFEGVKNPKEFMNDCHYQLNQVLKELAKYGRLGQYRLDRIKHTLSQFPKETK